MCPSRVKNTDNYLTFFRISFLLYCITIFVYSLLPVILNQEVVSPLPGIGKLAFLLIKTFSLLASQPVQVLFLSLVSYLVFRVFSKNKLHFSELYKIIFIALNLIVLYYIIEIIIFITDFFISVHLINIFSYSLNDIFYGAKDCSLLFPSIMARIKPLVLISIVYFFFLVKKQSIPESGFKTLLLIIASVFIVQLLLSSLPIIFLILLRISR